MSMSTVVVALNAQLLRRLELSPDSSVNAIGPAVSKKAVRL
jgi:hypothetical protein